MNFTNGYACVTLTLFKVSHISVAPETSLVLLPRQYSSPPTREAITPLIFSILCWCCLF